jgi:hypothetical protein
LAPVGKARIVPVTLNVSFADSTMSVSIANGLYTASQALGALSPVGRATIQGRYTVELPPINSTSTTTNGSTVSVDVTASAADNSPTLTLTAAVPSDVAIGWTVSGNGIPTGATVAGVSGDVITLSADTTAAISASAIVLSGPTNGTTSSQTTSPQDIPQGTGWMVVKLDAYGSAELEGMAGDGQAFSTRAYLGGSDSAPTLPFYWSKHEDTLAGSLAITPGTATTTSSTTTATTTLAGSTVAGTITYIRAKSHNQYYPRGFTQSITATGAAYIPAKPMHRTLEGGGYSGRLATLASSGSDLASFSDNLDFSEMDRCSVTDSNPANLNVRLRRPTGIIGGTFQDLNTGNTIHYAGVVLQSATSVGSGAGVFRGMHQSGTVTLTLTADTTSTTGTTTGTTTTGTTGTNGIPIVTTPTTGTSTTTGTNGLIGNQGTGNPILPGVTQ